MDEEDIADAEEARKIQTSNAFPSLGSTADETAGGAQSMDILRAPGETMGVKLLRKMGWRDGQGIGPKIRRRARLSEDRDTHSEEDQETHLFAPENQRMIAFIKKNDRKGLGFEGEGHLGEGAPNEQLDRPRTEMANGEDEQLGIGTLLQEKKMKKKPLARGGFGVGILDDNGSDDEDPYSMGPQISFNRTMGSDKKKKKRPSSMRTTANPLLNSKPVYISKIASRKTSSGFRRCHDGRLPLDGFVLSNDTEMLSTPISSDKRYSLPHIPAGWRSSKSTSNPKETREGQGYRSAAEVAKASTLSPKSRAALLGEAALPGKSVFDYLSNNARSKIVSATNNESLPPALNEASKLAMGTPSAKSLHSLVPELDSQTALTALGKGTAGWMPYGEDTAKRARYRNFLESRAGLRGVEPGVPERAPEHTLDDWIKEMHEFAHAAQIFKPMTGMMASRFTSSSSAPKLASDKPDNVPDPSSSAEGADNLITRPSEKKKDAAEEAASLGMFGPLTRSIKEWHPTRLLCKRFNVKPPIHVDPGEAPPGFEGGASAEHTHSSALPQKRLELVGKQDIDIMMREANLGRIGAREISSFGGTNHKPGESFETRVAASEIEEPVIVDTEHNESLERERPGEEIFKAIFGSDSEED